MKYLAAALALLALSVPVSAEPEDVAIAAGAGVAATATVAATAAPAVVAHSSGLAIMYSGGGYVCLLYTSPSPRDLSTSRMPSSA